jgi:hypothetical protein
MITVEIANISRRFEKDKFSIDILKDMIEQKLENGNTLCIGIKVDGESFDGALDNLEIDKVDSQIEVILVNTSDYIEEISFSGVTYIEEHLNTIENLGEVFYTDKSNDAWLSITELIESIMWMTNIMNLIRDNSQLVGVNDIKYSRNDVNEMIKEFYSAFEYKDDILMGDVILNRIVDFYKECKRVFNIVLGRE